MATEIETVRQVQWSAQQAAVLDWCREGQGSAIVEAVAGAGKSTVLVEAARVIRGSTLILAYGAKAAEDLRAKLDGAKIDWRKAVASTVHAQGWKALRKAGTPELIGPKKVLLILDALVAQGRIPADLQPHLKTVAGLVSLAKNMAIGILSRIEDAAPWQEIIARHELLESDDLIFAPRIIALAQETLRRSNDDLATVDYDDMCYLPLIHRLPMFRFDNVFVDEAQDTNPARRAMVRALVRKGGRVVACGDRSQAIFAWSGADPESLDLIKQDFSACELPLTISYRCPQAVVTFARQWVSHIESTPTAPEGEIAELALDDFLQGASALVNTSSAVLCRNNAPLVKLAFALTARQVPVCLLGKQHGEKLVQMAKRFRARNLNDLETKLGAFFEAKKTELTAAKEEHKLSDLEDQVETLRVIIRQCQNENKHSVAALIDKLENLFTDSPSKGVTLCSIHRAKGAEWETVYWLDRAHTCPNRWARQDWQIEQENNLCYVAATRAKRKLVEIIVGDRDE